MVILLAAGGIVSGEASTSPASTIQRFQITAELRGLA
jgi:hypothetical protein